MREIGERRGGERQRLRKGNLGSFSAFDVVLQQRPSLEKSTLHCCPVLGCHHRSRIVAAVTPSTLQCFLGVGGGCDDGVLSSLLPLSVSLAVLVVNVSVKADEAMSGSPVSSGRRAGGWRRLRRIDSGGPSETQQRTAPQREFITLDNDDEESEEVRTKEERGEERKEGRDGGIGGVKAEEGKEEEEGEDDSGVDHCSICLGRCSDPATLDSCSHSFCFVCIFRWCTDVSPLSTQNNTNPSHTPPLTSFAVPLPLTVCACGLCLCVG